jgi:hypothetical protein
MDGTVGARELVTALRAELAAVDPARPCDRRAERVGLGPAAIGRARTAAVARLAVRLERNLGGAQREDDAAFDWEGSAGHCRIAWLRGVFLARGSLSLAGGRTHLEFVVPRSDAPVLSARVAELGLPASWRVRRREGVVTWKSAATVLRFLRLAGGSAAVLDLEARLVTRSLGAELNRALNADTANAERAVAAGWRQVAAIGRLAGDGRLERLPSFVREVAAGRRDAPEASLAELAERLESTRSAVQRALARLESLALHPPGPGGPSGAERARQADRP